MSSNKPKLCVHKIGMLTSKQLFFTVLLDSTSLDKTHNVPDFLASQSFRPFSRSMQIMGKKIRFFDLKYIYYTNDFKSFLTFSNLLRCDVVLCSETGLKTWLFQLTALFALLHYLTKLLINFGTRKPLVGSESTRDPLCGSSMLLCTDVVFCRLNRNLNPTKIQLLGRRSWTSV